MADENGAAHERCGSLRHGLHEEVQNSEEENDWPKEDGLTGVGEVVEEASTDERLDGGRKDFDTEREPVTHNNLKSSKGQSVSDRTAHV